MNVCPESRRGVVWRGAWPTTFSEPGLSLGVLTAPEQPRPSRESCPHGTELRDGSASRPHSLRGVKRVTRAGLGPSSPRLHSQHHFSAGSEE